jgi:hypothetical protein
MAGTQRFRAAATLAALSFRASPLADALGFAVPDAETFDRTAGVLLKRGYQ